MISITRQKRKRQKIRLGKKTETGYEFKSNVDFKGDFSEQVGRLMSEKKANDELESQLSRLKSDINRFPWRNKKANLSYYYAIGRKLLFLENDNFKDVSPYSIYRRIYEEIPKILPHLKDKKVVQKHLETAYRLAHIRWDIISGASWNQWFEILKFEDIYKNKKLLGLVLTECKTGISYKALRNRIKELRAAKNNV